MKKGKVKARIAKIKIKFRAGELNQDFKNRHKAKGKNSAAKSGTSSLSSQTRGAAVILWIITTKAYWPK